MSSRSKAASLSTHNREMLRSLLSYHFLSSSRRLARRCRFGAVLSAFVLDLKGENSQMTAGHFTGWGNVC